MRRCDAVPPRPVTQKVRKFITIIMMGAVTDARVSESVGCNICQLTLVAMCEVHNHSASKYNIPKCREE